jgi:homoserine O-acetyltransferase
MAYALDELRKELCLEKIHTLIGGSMGGMQAMEWAIIQPDVFQNLILLATNARHSPWGIAFNEAQRMAIEADPTWKDRSPDAGSKGLAAARSMALLSYRNYEAYWNTQNETDIEKKDHYRAASYQRYQGDKLIQRFNCQSYYFLSKAMDAHHIGRGRGSIENAFSIIKSHTLVIGITSDDLFPISEQKYIAENIDGGVFAEINSFYGHDGFLIETVEIQAIILDFFKQKNVTWS